MRLAPRVIVVLVLLLPPVSRADLLGRVLNQPADPAGPGAAAPADDLTAWAGPVRATNLPELLKTAVQATPALRSARIDIAIAEARIMQTLSRDDWQLRALLSASRSSGGSFFNRGLGIDIETDPTYFIDASTDLFRVMPTGGTLTFHGDGAFSRTTSAVDGDSSENYTFGVSASYSQPLLRNRGRFYYEVNERRATLSRDAAVLAKRLAAINATQVVIAAYWDLVLAEQQVVITRQSLDLARERLRITQIGNEGGKIPRSEIPAVQQIIATREEDVLNGELAVLDRSIALRRVAGMPIGKGELGLRIGVALATRDAPFELGDLIERAYKASPELAQLDKQDAVARLDVELTENGLLPQLDAALTLGSTGSDTKIGNAGKNLAKGDLLFVGGTLTLQHSFGQESVKGVAREQREFRRKLAVSADDIRAQIAQAMSRAVAQLELAKRRIALSDRAIVLAEENIKIETDRFSLGKATNFDVLNRQEEKRQSELRRAQARIDWHKAEAVVQALTGDILPTYGIAID